MPARHSDRLHASEDLTEFIRILVVEDLVFSRQLLLQQLGRLGYDCEGAEHGEAALALLQRQSFDIILMDCHMPVMDGFSTTRAIRKLEGEAANTTVIAVTANVLPEDQHLCFAAGMDDYLCKPLQLETLSRVLKRWILKRKQSQQSISSLPPSSPQTTSSQSGLEESHSWIQSARQALRCWDWSGLEYSASYLQLIGETFGLEQMVGLAKQLLTSALRQNCTIALVTIQQLELIIKHLDESLLVSDSGPPLPLVCHRSEERMGLMAAAAASRQSDSPPQFIRRSRKGIPDHLLEMI
jgi:CheY-like chemotaxis protein